VRIDVRPVAKLRGRNPISVAPALGPVLDALSSSSLDLDRVNVVCDWIQYRSNFREPASCRPVLAERPRGQAEGPATECALEIAIDLRRTGEVDLATSLKEALAEHAAPAGADGQANARVPLEPWLPGSQSCLWRFNTLYWQALSQWEQATGREYEQALPGGQSQARDIEAARELIRELLRVWDELDARRALPEELYVAELGVGNGSQARTWLDAFAELDRAHGRNYYRRLHYLMGDYSAHVLERARQAVAHHSDKISTLVLEATRPQVTLGFLRGKAFCVYISNVYDNLPTDEVAIIRGRPYLVEVRAYLRQEDASQLARTYRTEPAELPALIGRLLRLGPDLLAEAAPDRFPGSGDAVAFWQDAWAALRLDERYMPLQGLDAYQVSQSATGEILRSLLESCGDVRMHVSNGALTSFAETLPLLHPYGRLICHDLFVTQPEAYQTGFYGPGKYDGSVVNWVNGPLLALIGNRRGFDVQIGPLHGRPSANVKTLTAQVRD
jgi:putative S-adenosyl-L-methionine-dependent methyltransferase